MTESGRGVGVDPLATARGDHTALRVPNFEETVRWYREKLGVREVARWQAPPYVDPELRFAYLERNGAVLEIVGGGRPTRPGPPPARIEETFLAQGYLHLCLRVENLDAAAAELRRRGVKIFAGPNHNPALNRRFIHVKDNNAFDLEFVEYLSRGADPGRRVVAGSRPVTSPRAAGIPSAVPLANSRGAGALAARWWVESPGGIR